MILCFLASDGNDSCLGELRNLAKASNETGTIHFGHDQIDEHEIGSKCFGNVECLRPAIGHVHLVAEIFHEQTQSVSTVSVVINHENPQSFFGRRHDSSLLPARLRLHRAA